MPGGPAPPSPIWHQQTQESVDSTSSGESSAISMPKFIERERSPTDSEATSQNEDNKINTQPPTDATVFNAGSAVASSSTKPSKRSTDDAPSASAALRAEQATVVPASGVAWRRLVLIHAAPARSRRPAHPAIVRAIKRTGPATIATQARTAAIASTCTIKRLQRQTDASTTQ